MIPATNAAAPDAMPASPCRRQGKRAPGAPDADRLTSYAVLETAPKSDWGCVRARIRRDWLAINYHGLTLDASEDSRVDRLSHEPPTAAGRKLATRSGSRTKISA